MADKKHGIVALFENTELSDSGKEEIQVMFEAAVSEAVKEKKDALEEEYKTKLDEAIEAAIPEIEKTVDEAITYVAEAWMTENKLAVNSGIKSDLVESFLTGLKTLFSEHYVEVPEEKVDVVEEMADIVAEKESELDIAISENLSLKKEINEMKKDAVIATVTEGMVETDVERFRSLVEDIDFIDEETFKGKADIVKKTYFGEGKMKVDDKEEKGDGELDRDGKGKEEKGNKKGMSESTNPYADYLSTHNK